MSDPSANGAITLVFDGFARTSLQEEASRSRLSPTDVVLTAVAYYLGDQPAERLARRVPAFAAHGTPVDPYEVEVDLSPGDREALELEAREQDVPLARLIEHAVLYYLADLSSGRVAARIVENSAG